MSNRERVRKPEAGEGPSRFGDGEVREKDGETSDEQAYLATLQELLTCACSWDGDARLLGNVRAADMVQALMFAIELKSQLAERTAEVERLKASKLCLSCLVEYEPPGNAGWRR